MGAAGFSETSVIYQTTWHHIHGHRNENFKSHNSKISLLVIANRPNNYLVASHIVHYKSWRSDLLAVGSGGFKSYTAFNHSK
jgi:hypothetical protein